MKRRSFSTFCLVFTLYAAIFAGLWCFFRMALPEIDEMDYLSYVQDGVSLLRHRTGRPEVVGYDAFNNGAEISGAVSIGYPNRLYSLLNALLYEARGKLFLWPGFLLGWIFSSLGMGALMLTFRRFFPRKDAVFLWFLTAFNLIFSQTLVRSLSDPVAWGIFSLLTVFILYRPRGMILSGVFSGILTLLRMQLVFYWPLLLWFQSARGGSRRKRVLSFAAGLTAALLVTAGFLLVLHFCLRGNAVPGAPAAASASGIEFYLAEIGRNFALFRWESILYFGRYVLKCFYLPLFGAVGALSFGMFFLKGDRRREMLRHLYYAAFLNVLLPLIFYSAKRSSPPDPRYFIYSIPFFYMAAWEVVRYGLLERWHKRPLLRTAGALLVLLAVIPMWRYYSPALGHRALFRDTTLRAYARYDELTSDILANFGEGKLFLTNMDWPIFLSTRRLVEMPEQRIFQRGKRNHLADGIVFFNWSGEDTPPRDFIADEEGNLFVFFKRYGSIYGKDIVVYRRKSN
ncbi:MAG: hypothetical protein PHS41_02565 [Victivallaceae bacterium]|nr:hypothetical protein [Victivallaceae bacterium]